MESSSHDVVDSLRKMYLIINRFQLTWEEQWGAVDPYNFVTVEQYLEDMHHVLNDRTLKKKAHRWLPYLFKVPIMLPHRVSAFNGHFAVRADI